MKRALLLLGGLSLTMGCLPQVVAAAYLARQASEGSGAFGWFRVTPGGLERVGAQLDGAACRALVGEDRGGPVYVLVHGAGGDGLEVTRARELLLPARHDALLLFRWVPWELRDTLVANLASGLSQVARCAPGRGMVLSHSAGGVLASLAAGRVQAPPGAPGPWLTVATIAAPLAGEVAGPRRSSEEELLVMLDFGAAQRYPRPAPGVRVLHLRTQLPGDPMMKPVLGHLPNDVRVGVPGARQVDLPPSLNHNGALVYVARRLADGSFEGWLDEPGR
ncbi:MAG: hypothetical protein IPJ65_40095 [Archangiaceae bacterium]|nr:hypothetical protein [Archangiaceae bacterium]